MKDLTKAFLLVQYQISQQNLESMMFIYLGFGILAESIWAKVFFFLLGVYFLHRSFSVREEIGKLKYSNRKD